MDDSARQLAERLQQTDAQLVLAESCTAGLVAATLTRVPGISQHLCGSAVVYQVATKSSWLNITPELIEAEGVVSEAVAQAMAVGVLEITPQATLSASITGDLGPEAPAETDGIAWICCRDRNGRSVTKKIELPSELSDNQDEHRPSLRVHRQNIAVEFLLRTLLVFLNSD